MSRTAVLLAENPKVKSMILRRGVKGGLARQFLAGEQLHEALQVVKNLQEKQLTASIEFLADDLVSAGETDEVVNQYSEILKGISTFYPEAWVSVRLSALGLVADPAEARARLVGLLENAVTRGSIMIMLTMEGAKYVQETLSIVNELHEQYPNLGVTLQSNLRRTDRDVTDLLASGVTIRLVKGGYKESPAVAYTTRDEIKAAYRRQMFELLQSGLGHSLATHDVDLINSAKLYAKQRNISQKTFGYEMFNGVRADLQSSLASAGYSVRIYLPYGQAWFPYVMARLEESPSGLGLVLSSML
ncbi:MAG: proline dehydrogenase family protein [Capsulimonadaceae bacterium]|nr:proline dehydrogenase family protein [Capsulimonadaceae bacterium]